MPWVTEAEHQRAITIASAADNVVVLPKLSIGELASIIEKARVAVGVDTGLSHLSAALNRPTVAIYTDTNPARTGVMASVHSKAINLGGVQQTPSVASVLDTIVKVSA
jgi:heptosyltransferase-1